MQDSSGADAPATATGCPERPHARVLPRVRIRREGDLASATLGARRRRSGSLAQSALRISAPFGVLLLLLTAAFVSTSPHGSIRPNDDTQALLRVGDSPSSPGTAAGREDPALDSPADLLGLTADGVDESATETDQAAVPPPATNTAEVADAVVYIASSDDAGAGFIVSGTQVLTAAHVVGSDSIVVVRFPRGHSLRGRVTARDQRLDVAVITVDGIPEGVRRLRLGRAGSPPLATSVWAWGFPYESRMIAAGFEIAITVSSGIISAHRLRDDVLSLQTDAAIGPGNSGGPLTTADGRAVGLITSILTVDGRDAEGMNLALDLTGHSERIDTMRQR